MKKILPIIFAVTLVFSMFSTSLASASSVKGSPEVNVNKFDKDLIELTDEQLQIYLTTGEIEFGELGVKSFLVSVGKKIAGKVEDAMIALSLDTARKFVSNWLTGSIGPTDVPKNKNLIKVSYAEFDPNSYMTWVCDTCVNADNYVLLVQRSINSLGISVGTLDGKWGPKTKAGVIEFQRLAGLTQDGSVGPTTWKRLAHK